MEFFQAIKFSNGDAIRELLSLDRYLVYDKDCVPFFCSIHLRDSQNSSALGGAKVLSLSFHDASIVAARDKCKELRNSCLSLSPHKNGRTPLYYAFRRSHIKIVELLFVNHASPVQSSKNFFQQYIPLSFLTHYKTIVKVVAVNV